MIRSTVRKHRYHGRGVGRSHRWRIGITFCAFAFPLVAAAQKEPLNYDRDVRPILSENCFPCHGQDSKKRMAGLRLDSFETATADRGGHVALSPGKPESSEIYKRITADKSRRMPPVFSNRNLTEEQIAILKRWIEEGGKYNAHWSFVPPVRPAIPRTSDPGWIKQPIDAFVLRRLEAEGLHPSAAASPRTWLRRVMLDLTGLPPSPAELDSFEKEVQARGEAAYNAAVDRLLASPAYGERMAMDWMDVARYADTHGFNNDSERSMWRWRDWVIKSFNENKPYDRFLTEQLAGDLLPHPTLDQRIATGFERNHVINSEGGIIDEEYRVEYVTDRVRTLGMAWLGLTLECAHCHDHKFDPITQRDHYRFYAFFNNVPEMGEDGRVANAVPIIPAPTAEQQKKLQSLQSAIDKVSGSIASREKGWRWRDSSGSPLLRVAGAATVPQGAAMSISCESASDFKDSPQNGFGSAEGLAGHACAPSEAATGLQTAGKGVPVSRRDPLTMSLWLNPSAADMDVALLSAIDYSQNPAAVSYGHGTELHLTGGEVEFRLSDRFPAYSIRVRSEGAGITPGQWRHVTVLYQGAPGKGEMRSQASWVRIFADGRELPTRVINDDLALPDGNKPTLTTFRVGWDNHPKSARYAGRLDEIAIWNRALSDAEIESAFRSRAIPYALARQREKKASTIETGWLRDASLEASDPVYVNERAERERLRGEWLALQREAPTVMVMQEMPTPRETHILIRGGYDTPGEKVEPGVPEQLLGAWPVGAPHNRLGLAQWLTKPDHPLTSRVVVNRFWQQLFGEGLVKTSDNFGMQGEWPSHPELLDWLAREFVDSGWNVKALMKRIVLSATYRQDSAAPPELVARDPENRLLARGPRFRLPAEIIRDQALQIAGLLKPRIGGPSVFPYQPADLYKGIVVAASYPGTKYVESKGDDLYRRSLYTFWKRTVPHPTMNVFDAPDREVCIVRRSITNTPLQALTLLNDPIFVEAARKLAERSIHEGGAGADDRIAFAFRLATGRLPDASETAILRSTLTRMLAAYRADESSARSLLAVGASGSDQSIPVSELAAYTAVANVILNMDETITKG
ncbi:MAG TPA: DUF1553 domain-containing protein [Bryobacteraceae bacterium]|nr:DUF1553 domain-containing protein [Bryobacteraceae bacterium]